MGLPARTDEKKPARGGLFEGGYPMRPCWGRAIELAEVLELARTSRIHAHVEHFALERAAEACQRMRERSLKRGGP